MENSLIKKSKGRQPGAIITWTDERTEILRKLFPYTDNAEIADQLDITERAIRSKAQVLGIKKVDRYWSNKDCKWLIKNYPILPLKDIMQHFPQKTKWAIINKYRSLAGLRQDNGK